MDDETREYLEAMEHRLIEHMDSIQDSTDTALKAMHDQIGGLRTEMLTRFSVLADDIRALTRDFYRHRHDDHGNVA